MFFLITFETYMKDWNTQIILQLTKQFLIDYAEINSWTVKVATILSHYREVLTATN